MSEETGEKKLAKLLPSRFGVASFKTNRWAAVVEHGTSYEEVRDNPAYWAHITTSGKLKPSDIIEVHADDLTFYAELYVVTVDKQAGARVAELRFVSLDKSAALPASEEFKIEHAGPHHKWRIVRTKDNVVVQHGFTTKEEATQAALQTNKKLAA